MFSLILAIIIGILAGTITSLIPGIHINLIAIFIIGISTTLLNLTTSLTLVIFITAMAITHTFVDFLPSIFLGAPDIDTALSVLPGHKLLLKGRAYPATIFTLYGSLIALPIIIIFTIPFIYILPIIYPYVVRIMPIILILISTYLILTEKQKKLWALIIFLLAGFLGIATLNLPQSSFFKEPLLPLLTGLFGASNLFISIKNKTKIPQQKIIPLKNIKLRKSSIAKSTLASIIASPLTAFLPGLGASQAAVIGSTVIQEKKELDQREFLFLLGAINTIVMGLSLITLYSIQKTRTGTAVAISKLITPLTKNGLFYIILTIIIAGIVAFFITILLAKFISKHIHKIPYSKLSLIILIILTAIVTIISGPLGLFIFIISTSLGISTIIIGIRRMHLMGCLLIPTILYYLS